MLILPKVVLLTRMMLLMSVQPTRVPMMAQDLGAQRGLAEVHPLNCWLEPMQLSNPRPQLEAQQHPPHVFEGDIRQ